MLLLLLFLLKLDNWQPMFLLARDDDFEGRGGKGMMEAVWRVLPLALFGHHPIIVNGHPCRGNFSSGAGREEDGGHCIRTDSRPNV